MLCVSLHMPCLQSRGGRCAPTPSPPSDSPLHTHLQAAVVVLGHVLPGRFARIPLKLLRPSSSWRLLRAPFSPPLAGLLGASRAEHAIRSPQGPPQRQCGGCAPQELLRGAIRTPQWQKAPLLLHGECPSRREALQCALLERFDACVRAFGAQAVRRERCPPYEHQMDGVRDCDWWCVVCLSLLFRRVPVCLLA